MWPGQLAHGIGSPGQLGSARHAWTATAHASLSVHPQTNPGPETRRAAPELWTRSGEGREKCPGCVQTGAPWASCLERARRGREPREGQGECVTRPRS